MLFWVRPVRAGVGEAKRRQAEPHFDRMAFRHPLKAGGQETTAAGGKTTRLLISFTLSPLTEACSRTLVIDFELKSRGTTEKKTYDV